MITKFLISSALIALSFVPFACSSGQTSGRQQTCSNSGDCKEGLLCVNAVCVQNDYPVTATAKECVAVECNANEDCCADFEPSSNCDFFKEECQAGGLGSQIYCEQAEGPLCVCKQECQDARCITPQTCTSDSQCGFGRTCDVPTGKCVECTTNDQCDVDAGEMCKLGLCEKGCVVNEDCPFFNACTAGECVYTGCLEDRDCILYRQRADAVCKEVKGKAFKECVVPCEENAECPSLHVCENGECAFLGCENDEQCRPYLGLNDNDFSVPKKRAVCLPIDRDKQPQ